MSIQRSCRLFLCKDTKKNKKPSFFPKFFITFAKTFSNRAIFARNRKNKKL